MRRRPCCSAPGICPDVKHGRSGGLRFQPSGGTRSTQQVPTGKKQRLSIERLANDGRGIAFVEGRTWFVSGALADEQVEARVLGARAQIVEARAEKVLVASPLRRAEPCAHAGQCGGCTLQHLPHAEQLALKQRTLAEQLSRVAGLEPEAWAAPLVGPEFAYRRRARIAVRWDAKAARLDVGFAPPPARPSSASMTASCWYSPCSLSSVRYRNCCAAWKGRKPSVMSSSFTAMPRRCCCATSSHWVRRTCSACGISAPNTRPSCARCGRAARGRPGHAPVTVWNSGAWNWNTGRVISSRSMRRSTRRWSPRR